MAGAGQARWQRRRVLRRTQAPPGPLNGPAGLLTLILLYLTSVLGINYLMAPGRIREQGPPQAVWGPQSQPALMPSQRDPRGEMWTHEHFLSLSLPPKLPSPTEDPARDEFIDRERLRDETTSRNLCAQTSI